jgi:hypothetical protein
MGRLLLCQLSLLGLACLCRGDVIYTYEGNTFNDLRNGATCPPTCNVTGWFDLAQPLLPNMDLTLLTPISFEIMSDSVKLTDGEPTDTVLYIGTDSLGDINQWTWQVVGPASSPTARIVTQNEPSNPNAVTFDELRTGTGAPPLVGPIQGLLVNDPGTWSTAPEPKYVPLFAAAMIAVALAVQRLRAKPQNSPDRCASRI